MASDLGLTFGGFVVDSKHGGQGEMEAWRGSGGVIGFGRSHKAVVIAFTDLTSDDFQGLTETAGHSVRLISSKTKPLDKD